ncbi:MAG: ABC transporter ATP-binding protein [Clostridium sp.]|nr:ABC transporter ATP-binding protein [Clostridium sp.]
MIEFKNVYKTINGNPILKGLNLKIRKGELVTLIGPSGCGKTTTLKMINKLIKSTSGEILIDGKNIKNEDTIKLRRNMGYVIQQTGLMPHLTVKENIEIIPKLEKQDKDKINKNTEKLFKMVGMDLKYLNKYPGELSGGQQQRVGIARAFAMNPDIILMDEPFSALDPITREQLQDEVFNIQQNVKKTIVFVTHDMNEALKLADKMCIMKKGEIIQFDTPENILKNPINDFVKEFVGKNRIWDTPEFIKASDIMINDPAKARCTRSILQGIEIMRSNHVDKLLVVDNYDKLCGMITLRHLMKNISSKMKLQEIMDKDIITAYYDDSIVDVMGKMDSLKVGYIPIVDKDYKLLGLITESSLLTVISSQYIDSEVNVCE